MDYIVLILVKISIYSILCMSANILTGLTHKISLGFAAFFGIGAYITALSVNVLNIGFFSSFTLIIFINGLISLLIALPSIKLKGDYFILVTLGFQMIIYSILNNWTSLTNGPFGISFNNNALLIFNLKMDNKYSVFIFSVIVTFLLGLFFYYLIKSPFGRVLRALNDDELALMALGKNVNFFKISVFVIASSFTGIAGYIYAIYNKYIDPTIFTLDESIFILTAIMIGGLGNIKGAISGAAFVVIIPELLRFIGLPDSIAAPLRQIIYGSILIWIIFFRKQGIAGVKQLEN